MSNDENNYVYVFEMLKSDVNSFDSLCELARNHIYEMSVEELTDLYESLSDYGSFRDIEDGDLIYYQSSYNKSDCDEDKVAKVQAAIAKERCLEAIDFLDSAWKDNEEHVTTHTLVNSRIVVYVDKYDKRYFQILADSKLNEILKMRLALN